MREEIIKIGIYQIVETEEFSLVDKIEVDLDTNKFVGMSIGE